MQPHLLLQQRHEFRLHELIPIGDIQANDFLSLQGRREPLPELGPMLLLHHENQIGPFDLLCTQHAVRIGRRAGGIRFDSRAGEQVLGGGTAELVSAADEKHADEAQATPVRQRSAHCPIRFEVSILLLR